MQILIVEDEPLVLGFLKFCLEEAGHHVIPATRADKALALIESRATIELVVSDIELPGSFNGLILAKEIHKRWPNRPVLLMSGRVEPRSCSLPPNALFLAKPFSSDTIVAAIDRLKRDRTPIASRKM